MSLVLCGNLTVLSIYYALTLNSCTESLRSKKFFKISPLNKKTFLSRHVLGKVESPGSLFTKMRLRNRSSSVFLQHISCLTSFLKVLKVNCDFGLGLILSLISSYKNRRRTSAVTLLSLLKFKTCLVARMTDGVNFYHPTVEGEFVVTPPDMPRPESLYTNKSLS